MRKNIFYSYFALLFSMGSSFILPPLFINNFESDFYANILVCSSLSPWLSLTLLGIPQYVVTIVSRSKYNFQKYEYSKYALLMSIFAVIVSLFYVNVVGFDYFFKDEMLTKYSSFIYLTMTALVVKFILDVFSSILVGLFMIHITKVIEISMIVVNIVVVLYVIYFKADINLIPISNLIFSLFVIAILTIKGINKVSINIYYKKIRLFIKGALPFFLTTIPGLAFWNTDVLILNYFLESEDVISYSILFRIISTFLLMFGIMNNILVPYISRKFSHKEFDFILLSLKRQTFLYTTFGLLLSIAFLQYIDLFINFWVGDGKIIVDKGTKFLFIVFFLTFLLTSIMNIHVMAFNCVKKVIYVTWLEAVLNLFLSITLVQYLGIKGVILGTSLAIMLTQLIFIPRVVYTQLCCKNYFMNYFYKNYMYSLIVIFCFYFIDANLFSLNFLALFFSYVIFILINKDINLKELFLYYKGINS